MAEAPKLHEYIKIIPKTKYLKSDELLALRNDESLVVVASGLKKTMPNNTNEEAKELDDLYERLEKQLSKTRIERLAGRTLAEWDDNLKAVRVIRKDGKFSNFGYNHKGQLYLEYYEALFLLEMNRLQLEYNKQLISIEQAYLLLMGESASDKYVHYLVYSNLTRAGYILIKHQNIRFDKLPLRTAEDCVWALLEQELHPESKTIETPCKFLNYKTIKEQFDNCKQQIRSPAKQNKIIPLISHESKKQQILNFREKFQPKAKRSAAEAEVNQWHKAKRHCGVNLTYTANTSNDSLLNFLKSESLPENFKKVFQKFDIISMKNYETNVEEEREEEEWLEDKDGKDEEDNSLSIAFDVYLPREGFRKSNPGPPNFRVIILKPKQSFPTHQQIYQTHRQQLQPITLILVTVNESKQVQAFIYYFS